MLITCSGASPLVIASVLPSTSWPSIVDTVAPGEIARQPFLRDQELGLLEEAGGLLAQIAFGFDLHHVEPEAAVRQLEHARQPERGNELLDVATEHDQRAGRRDAMPDEQQLH